MRPPIAIRRRRDASRNPPTPAEVGAYITQIDLALTELSTRFAIDLSKLDGAAGSVGPLVEIEYRVDGGQMTGGPAAGPRRMLVYLGNHFTFDVQGRPNQSTVLNLPSGPNVTGFGSAGNSPSGTFGLLPLPTFFAFSLAKVNTPKFSSRT